MVNSKFELCQERRWRRWRLCLTTVCLFAAVVCGTAADASAQDQYNNQEYRIFRSQPQSRIARAPAAVTPRNTPQPFGVEAINPPVPQGYESPATPQTTKPANRFSALSKAFSAGSTRTAVPTRRIQDIFKENPQDDIFGENNTAPGGANAPSNPFQKVDPQPEAQDPNNPFGEITPTEDPQDPPTKNPFNEIPIDPNPNTPPMDTTPRGQTQIDPVLPPGSEYTPDLGQINPNPPIPGEEERPVDDEPGGLELPDENQSRDDIPEEGSEKSVFDSKDEETDPDLKPVPTPASSRVYYPARVPTDIVKAGDPSQLPAYPPGFDPRMNPYAKLPGPYGYAQPPYPGYTPGPNGYAVNPYAPSPYAPNPYAPNPYAMPYGQCGPGCVPANTYAAAAAPLPLAATNCGGCNTGCNDACNSCNTCVEAVQPALACTDIGERIVETGVADCCPTETYTDVVSDCDNICSNYTSCYIGLFGGWADLNDLVTRGEIGSGIYMEDGGYVFGATLGQIQGRNLRTELEVSYRNININGMRLDGNVPSQVVGVNGDFGALAGMLNAYWEFVDFGSANIKPYIGGGVGFALARPDLIQADGSEAVINDSESSFAWQYMAGLNYKASPILDAFVEYRYFAADSFRLDTEIPEVAGFGNGSGPFDYRSSAVLFGLRARF